MRLLRVENPEDAIKLYPWLVLNESQSRMEIVYDIYDWLKTKPDEIFILVAVDDVGVAHGVLIAHVSETKKRSIWIYQAQANPGFTESRAMFDALIQWAKTKRAKMIRAGVNGHEKVFERRWGFKKYNDEMRLKL